MSRPDPIMQSVVVGVFAAVVVTSIVEVGAAIFGGHAKPHRPTLEERVAAEENEKRGR